MELKEYTLKEEQKGIFALKANGNYQTCPFQHPTPVPNKLTGGMQLIAAVCSSQCAHFQFTNTKELSQVRLYCSGYLKINLTSIEVLPEAPKSSLIIT